MRLVNLCRNTVRLQVGGKWVDFPGSTPSVHFTYTMVDDGNAATADGEVPIKGLELEIRNLPPPVDDTLFIVPYEIMLFRKERLDLVSVNGTMGAKRDKEGTLLGFTSLQRLS